MTENTIPADLKELQDALNQYLADFPKPEVKQKEQEEQLSWEALEFRKLWCNRRLAASLENQDLAILVKEHLLHVIDFKKPIEVAPLPMLPKNGFERFDVVKFTDSDLYVIAVEDRIITAPIGNDFMSGFIVPIRNI